MIAQHKNGRYYKCEVIRIQDELFCKAAFDDGSLSTNLYPEDIQVRLSVFLECYFSES